LEAKSWKGSSLFFEHQTLALQALDAGLRSIKRWRQRLVANPRRRAAGELASDTLVKWRWTLDVSVRSVRRQLLRELLNGSDAAASVAPPTDAFGGRLPVSGAL
jgi:hypothetical protein